MASEINDVDLKLNILASDEASSVLKGLDGVLAALKDNIIGFADLKPFVGIQDAADALATTVKGLTDNVIYMQDAFAGLASGVGLSRLVDQMSQLDGRSTDLLGTLGAIRGEIAAVDSVSREDPLSVWNSTAAELRDNVAGVVTETTDVDDAARTDPFAGWTTAIQGVKEQMDGVVADLRLIAELSSTSFGMPVGGSGSSLSSSRGGGIVPVTEEQKLDWFANVDQSSLTPEQRAEYARAAVNNDVGSFYTQYGVALGAPQPTTGIPTEENPPLVPEVPPEEPGGFKMPSVANAIGGINSAINEIPSKLMMAGMTGMMAYYGIQGLAGAGNQFANIQQIMQQNNQTVNEAAQASVMLGSVGLGGTAGTSFLANMAGNLQKTFTPQAGSGALSQNAILLQSLGVTQQDITQSPWQLLNTIGEQYRSLIGQGQGSKAAELLNLTGTTQAQSLLENWGTLKQGASDVNLNMSPDQLGQSVKQSAGLQEDLQKLGLAFDQLAIKLDPAVEGVVKALTDLSDGLSGKTGFGQTVTNIAKDLGTLGDVILGFIAAVKIAELGLGIASGAGLVEGVTGGGLLMGAGKLIGKAGKGIAGLVGGSTAAGAGAAEVGAETAGVGGEIAGAEAVGAAADATGVGLPVGLAIGLGAPLVIEAIAHWKELSSWVGKTGGEIGDWAQKTSSQISSWASQHITDLTNWATQTGQYISSWASIHAKDIGNWANKTGSDIAIWAITHATDLANWVNQTGSNISTWAILTGQHIQSWVTDTGKNIGDWTTEHAKDIAKWASDTGSKIGSWTIDHTKDILGWASNTGSKIGDWVSTHTDDLVNWATNTGFDISTWATDRASDIAMWAKNTSDSFNTWYNSTISVIGNWVKSVAADFGVELQNIGTDIGKGVNSVVNWMGEAANNIKNTVSSLFGGGSNALTSQANVSSAVMGWIQTAMANVGVSGSTWTNLLTNLIQAESGGNPSSVNSQAVNGEHATGIAQMLPSTFAEYMKQGMSDILNPIDNLVASIQYIMSRYGSPQGLVSQTGLGTSSYKGYADGGLLTEPIVGIGLNTGTQYSFAENEPEYIIPASGGRVMGGPALAGAGGGGVNQTFYVTVTVPTSARDVKAMAQAVATEFVNQVKRRGNFDWS